MRRKPSNKAMPKVVQAGDIQSFLKSDQKLLAEIIQTASEVMSKEDMEWLNENCEALNNKYANPVANMEESHQLTIPDGGKALAVGVGMRVMMNLMSQHKLNARKAEKA